MMTTCALTCHNSKKRCNQARVITRGSRGSAIVVSFLQMPSSRSMMWSSAVPHQHSRHTVDSRCSCRPATKISMDTPTSSAIYSRALCLMPYALCHGAFQATQGGDVGGGITSERHDMQTIFTHIAATRDMRSLSSVDKIKKSKIKKSKTKKKQVKDVDGEESIRKRRQYI